MLYTPQNIKKLSASKTYHVLGLMATSELKWGVSEQRICVLRAARSTFASYYNVALMSVVKFLDILKFIKFLCLLLLSGFPISVYTMQPTDYYKSTKKTAKFRQRRRQARRQAKRKYSRWNRTQNHANLIQIPLIDAVRPLTPTPDAILTIIPTLDRLTIEPTLAEHMASLSMTENNIFH